MNAKGFVHKYGDHVDTDVIIPARYLNTQSHAELAAHCMEDIDKDFIGRLQQGDIMVVGANFGCGSSREHAPIAIAASGISCVIAASFARIFYRNAINIGLAFWSVPPLRRPSKTATRWPWTLTAAPSPTSPRGRRIRPSPSRPSSRT